MAYIAPEIVQEVKQIDLLSYLRTYEPQELVRVSPNVYSTVTHDSLKISNGKWMWWAEGIGGKSALDYLIKVRGLSFTEAVEHLANRTISVSQRECQPKKEKPKVLSLPEKSPSNEKVIRYLLNRGIDKSILRYCIKQGMIYESLPYHNAVFLGFDEHKIPKYAAYRATKDARIMGECEGSDKRFSFRFVGNGNTSVHLFECAIDLLSYITIRRRTKSTWYTDNYLSLGGISVGNGDGGIQKIPIALESYLEDNRNTECIYLHLDNDNAGETAALNIEKLLGKTYEVIDVPPLCGKDVNDFLCYCLGKKTWKEKKDESRNISDQL